MSLGLLQGDVSENMCAIVRPELVVRIRLLPVGKTSPCFAAAGKRRLSERRLTCIASQLH